MQRLLLGAALLAVLCLGVRAADDKKEEKKADFPALQKEFIGKYRAADAEEKAKILKEYSPKFLEAAKADKSPGTIGFTFQVAVAGKNHEMQKELTGLIRKEHLKKRSIRPFLGLLAGMLSEDNMVLLADVIKENPDKKVQFHATKAYVQANKRMAQLAGQLKDNEEAKKGVTNSRGENFVKYVIANAEKFEKNAKDSEKALKENFKGLFPDLSIGKAAPEVVSKDPAGKEVKLSALKGKVVVLDIWATWCPPCRAMIPHEREMVKKFKGKPFVLVSVSADNKLQDLTDFLKKNEMPWTHWYEGANGKLIEDWQVEYFPSIYVLDHKGVIRFKDVRGEKMEEAVEKLLKELDDSKKSS
jgi:thiol-disulfide isomerase/thioredoxin